VLAGPILGPVLGGLIVEHLSWRWIFWVNVPFCVVGLLLAWRLMPAGPRDRSVPLDVVGLLLLSPGVAALIYGLSRAGTEGGFGSTEVLLPVAAGVLLVVAFTVRALVMRGSPLVDVRLFGTGSFSVSSALLFLSGFVLYGAMLLLPLYYQQVRGADPFTAGLLLAPQGIGLLATRGLAGTLTDRIGPRWVTFVGLIVVVLGTLPFTAVGHDTNEWLLAAALVVRGAGLGAVTIPVMTGAYQGLARAQVPHASIITRTAQQIGGSFGTAVLAAILQSQLTVQSDRAAAFDRAFWWSVAFTAAAVVLSLALPARPAPLP
jgi:EmrB/QacA subfamily drug resistance transporter